MVDNKTDPKSDEAARYGHFSLNELRDAVESIEAGIEAGSPVFSPVSDGARK
jgi:hypothetical protein